EYEELKYLNSLEDIYQKIDEMLEEMINYRRARAKNGYDIPINEIAEQISEAILGLRELSIMAPHNVQDTFERNPLTEIDISNGQGIFYQEDFEKRAQALKYLRRQIYILKQKVSDAKAMEQGIEKEKNNELQEKDIIRKGMREKVNKLLKESNIPYYKQEELDSESYRYINMTAQEVQTKIDLFDKKSKEEDEEIKRATARLDKAFLIANLEHHKQRQEVEKWRWQRKIKYWDADSQDYYEFIVQKNEVEKIFKNGTEINNPQEKIIISDKYKACNICQADILVLKKKNYKLELLQSGEIKIFKGEAQIASSNVCKRKITALGAIKLENKDKALLEEYTKQLSEKFITDVAVATGSIKENIYYVVQGIDDEITIYKNEEEVSTVDIEEKPLIEKLKAEVVKVAKVEAALYMENPNDKDAQDEVKKYKKYWSKNREVINLYQNPLFGDKQESFSAELERRMDAAYNLKIAEGLGQDKNFIDSRCRLAYHANLMKLIMIQKEWLEIEEGKIGGENREILKNMRENLLQINLLLETFYKEYKKQTDEEKDKYEKLEKYNAKRTGYNTREKQRALTKDYSDMLFLTNVRTNPEMLAYMKNAVANLVQYKHKQFAAVRKLEQVLRKATYATKEQRELEKKLKEISIKYEQIKEEIDAQERAGENAALELEKAEAELKQEVLVLKGVLYEMPIQVLQAYYPISFKVKEAMAHGAIKNSQELNKYLLENYPMLNQEIIKFDQMGGFGKKPYDKGFRQMIAQGAVEAMRIQQQSLDRLQKMQQKDLASFDIENWHQVGTYAEEKIEPYYFRRLFTEFLDYFFRWGGFKATNLDAEFGTTHREMLFKRLQELTEDYFEKDYPFDTVLLSQMDQNIFDFHAIKYADNAKLDEELKFQNKFGPEEFYKYILNKLILNDRFIVEIRANEKLEEFIKNYPGKYIYQGKHLMLFGKMTEAEKNILAECFEQEQDKVKVEEIYALSNQDKKLRGNYSEDKELINSYLEEFLKDCIKEENLLTKQEIYERDEALKREKVSIKIEKNTFAVAREAKRNSCE
ncbi:MAG: hypothetical protein KKA19_03830, partial [Candidatus Margulisbacteria bacterium]|nr:hypothetical protein [Candidatus Margulisiibacteriota bacterium]